RFGLAAVAAASLVAHASAAELAITPEVSNLQAVLDQAAEGDEVRLSAGTYRGPLRITGRITLARERGAVGAGSPQGSVGSVAAPGGVVRGIEVRGSGRSLETMDSGIFVEQSARAAVIEDNRLEDNLFGVYVHGAPDAVVRHNRITGLRQARVSEAGNGVSV